jgi:PBP1b-binding outer membrane lipoprotein LpoB
MKSRNRTRIVWVTCITGITLILSSCSPGMRAEESPAAETQEDTMHLAAQTETQPAAIPPIDAAVPATIETAAFGLG